MKTPLIVQNDNSILFHIDTPNFWEVREFLSKFAVAEKTPAHIHNYKIDAVSLWNASALWFNEEFILNWLEKYAQYGIPDVVQHYISMQIWKYWKIILQQIDDNIWVDTNSNIGKNKQSYFALIISDKHIFNDLEKLNKFNDFIIEENQERKLLSKNIFIIEKKFRGKLKAFLIELWYPTKDIIWYSRWEELKFDLKWDWDFREYQQEAIDSFYKAWTAEGGSGVIVLACGWWKTIVWIGAIFKEQTQTLIITTTENAVYQFKNEIINKTTLTEKNVWVYSWKHREIKDITITTYAMLTYRRSKNDELKNMEVFDKKNWGLIIYDEVHMLPAPVFSFSTNLQAKKRLWLTATLVREDNKENMIFWLIWPKRYDMPWKDLEDIGFIAKVECVEKRLAFNSACQQEYYDAENKRLRFKIAAKNLEKIEECRRLIKKHSWDKILIIWEYIEQLEKIQEALDLPIITGKVKPEKREELFNQFREWKIDILLLSRVANFAIDLPDANVLIQISWLYGSRQEEAQRLGRILRPKEKNNTATFYSLVTNDSIEIEYAEKRQLFLMEQWYEYDIVFG